MAAEPFLTREGKQREFRNWVCFNGVEVFAEENSGEFQGIIKKGN